MDSQDHFRFVLNTPAASDVRVTAETSVSLDENSWTTLATRTGNGPWIPNVTENVPPVTVSTEAPGLDRIVVIRPSTGDSRRFYRLRLELME